MSLNNVRRILSFPALPLLLTLSIIFLISIGEKQYTIYLINLISNIW